MKVCFFVRLKDPALFNIVGFYKSDIDSLRALGHEVICVHRLRDLPTTRCDLYFIWWFGFGFFPVALGRLLGRSSILVGTAHTADGGGLEQWPWIKRCMMKAAMALADLTLFISKTDLRRLGTFKPRRSRIVYCSLDAPQSLPSNRPKENIIMAVTHLTRENVRRKMLVESIEAFAAFRAANPEYVFHICGSFGDGVEAVQSKCRALALGNSVVLRGRISEAEKTELLQKARLYLQPSQCEGFGLAILEAQAAGTPVVTNREPCIVEISGDSVTFGDTLDELRTAMQRLVSDSAFYAEMRARGLANVRRYSNDARQRGIAQAIATVSGDGRGESG